MTCLPQFLYYIPWAISSSSFELNFPPFSYFVHKKKLQLVSFRFISYAETAFFLWWYMSELYHSTASSIPCWDFSRQKTVDGMPVLRLHLKEVRYLLGIYTGYLTWYLTEPLLTSCQEANVGWIFFSYLPLILCPVRQRAAVETLPEEHKGYFFDLNSRERDDDDSTDGKYFTGNWTHFVTFFD